MSAEDDIRRMADRIVPRFNDPDPVWPQFGNGQGIRDQLRRDQQFIDNYSSVLAEASLLKRAEEARRRSEFAEKLRRYPLQKAFQSGEIIQEQGYWSDWKHITSGKPPLFPATMPNGSIELFYVSKDKDLRHAWREGAGILDLSSWHSEGGHITSDFAVGTNFNDCLEVFARGTNNQVYNKLKTHPYGGWSDWGELGGKIISAPSVQRLPDKRTELFAVGEDRAVWHKWHEWNERHELDGRWSNWDSLGGIVGNEITTARNQDGRLEVYAIGTDSKLYSNWHANHNGQWSGWHGAGEQYVKKVVATNTSEDRIELFALTPEGRIVNRWQHSANGDWSDWHNFSPDGIYSNHLTAVQNRLGNAEVFADIKGDEYATLHRPFRGSGEWSKWIYRPNFTHSINSQGWNYQALSNYKNGEYGDLVSVLAGDHVVLFQESVLGYFAMHQTW